MPPSAELPRTPTPPENLLHNAALAGAILSPLVMLLPPRRLDFRTFFLAGTFFVCTNHLSHDYTGTSIYARFSRRLDATTGLPEGARRTQELLRERKERDAAQMQRHNDDGNKGGLKSMVNSAWMGGEGKDWQAKRAAEHQRSFDEGKSISDVIFEQIADVWNGNWGGDAKKKDDEADTKGNNEAGKR